jgi:nitroreductase
MGINFNCLKGAADMTVMEAIQGRRSIRKYSARPVEEEKLSLVMEAARLAPSAGNGQHWKFIIVTDPAVKKKLMEISGGQQFIDQAPMAVVAVGTKPGIMTNSQPAEAIDLSIALSYLLLEAHEQGLGACWIANYDQAKMKELLGIPGSASVVAVTPLGYPAEEPAQRPRKRREEIICYNRFA